MIAKKIYLFYQIRSVKPSHCLWLEYGTMVHAFYVYTEDLFMTYLNTIDVRHSFQHGFRRLLSYTNKAFFISIKSE